MKSKIVVSPALAAIAMLLVACAGASSQAHLLKIGMPEAEVISLLGEPDEISIRTCGSDLDEPWTCKIHKYIGWPNFTVGYHEIEPHSNDWYLNHFITE